MRKAALLAIAVGGVTPLLLLGAPQAKAATSCYAGGCYNKIAAETTCVNDAYVAEKTNMYDGSTAVGYIELEYSPSCRATWARVISDTSYGSQAEVASSSQTEGCDGGDTPGTGCNTRMINDANVTSVAAGWIYTSATDPHSVHAVTAAF